MALRQVTVDAAIEFLNELLLVDRYAIDSLFTTKNICNDALAEHPTVQTRQVADSNVVTTLGVLNGMFGTVDGYGPICMVLDNLGALVRFERTPVTPN